MAKKKKASCAKKPTALSKAGCDLAKSKSSRVKSGAGKKLANKRWAGKVVKPKRRKTVKKKR